MKIPQDQEIGWAAGLFEGEGTVSCGSSGYPAISLSMTDREPVEKFAELFNMRVGGPYTQGRILPIWKAHTQRGVVVVEIWDKIGKFLSPRRQDQFGKAFSRAKKPERTNTIPAGLPPCGHTKLGLSSGYSRHRRRGEVPCDACRAEYKAYHRNYMRRYREKRT